MRFHQFMGCVAAFLIAAWAFVIGLFVGTVGLVPVSFTFVLANALVLGLPIFLILRWKRWVNPITCICGGFLVAAASGVVPNWPSTATNLALRTNAWVGGVQRYIDGVPTAAAWLDFARDLIFLGVFGGIAVLISGTLVAIPDAVWGRLFGLTGTAYPFLQATYSNQLQPLQTRMAFLANNNVIVHGDP